MKKLIGYTVFFVVGFVLSQLIIILVAEAQVSCETELPKKVVCFGDSITMGYGVEEEDKWCTQVGELPGYNTVNLGISYTSSRSALERFNNVLDEHPQIVIIMLGLGDAYDPDGDGVGVVPIDEYENNMSYMIRVLKQRRIRVILQTSTCTLDTAFNARVKANVLSDRKLAKRFRVSLVENYSPCTEGVMEGQDLFVDYAHYNAIGQSWIFDGVRKALKE